MNITQVLTIIFIALLVIFLIKLCFRDGLALEHFEDKPKEEIPTVKRPFVNIYDNFGKKLNVILISKPFQGDHEMKVYEENKDKNIFIGIASYLEFPNMVSNPYENFTENYNKYKYKEIAEGWIHCFRKPEDYFPPDMPLLFASESDWTDCNVCKPDPTIKKEYDFIYICLKVDQKKDKCDDWATYNKNWTLAKKCLDIFCNKFKLKGLLIGRQDCKLPNGCNKYMDTTNMLNYDEMKKSYNKAKFIFIPNEKDASPRVLTEAMAINLPVLLNKNILGGWKYINDKTGELFTDENDVSQALNILLDKIERNVYTPRQYFIENYSVINSGRNLKKFLYKHWGDRINIPEINVDYVSPEFSKKDFKECKIDSENK